MSAKQQDTLADEQLVAIRMPQDQQDGTRAVLAACLKQVGDAVSAHEPVAEVETDKVVVELAAQEDGVLSEWCHQVGDDLAPGSVVARLRTGSAPTGAAAAAPAAEQTGTEPSGAVVSEPPTGDPAQVTPDARLRLSPAVKRLLAEHRLDLPQLLRNVRGSGRNGRLSAADVRRYLAQLEQQGTGPGTAVASPPGPRDNADPALPGVDGGAARRVPLSPMRRAIAEHMSRSLLQTAPHVTTVFECDMTRVLAHRKAHRTTYGERGAELTLTAYFVAATARALQAVPEVNSSLDGDDLLLWNEINMGIAVALGDDGLVVPVLRGVQQMNLLGIAQGLAELSGRARARKLTTADMQGGTFTISNHGVSGSLMAAPVIINQPQSAILGIGKLRKEVVVREVDGEDLIRIAPMCYLTLTLDHRVLDAYTANSFLSKVVAALEGWGAEQET